MRLVVRLLSPIVDNTNMYQIVSLLFVHHLFLLFQDIDAAIARKVRASILQHPWYLSQQLVVLAFFDREVAEEEKANMAAALRAIPKPAVFLPKKPRFPTGTLQTVGSTLTSFVGPDSWLAFALLGIDDGWLDLPPAEWPHDQRYAEMGAIMGDLAVVNDTAERCVKDIQDFANAARDGDHRGNIVLVSGSHRVKLPSFLKNEMEEQL